MKCKAINKHFHLKLMRHFCHNLHHKSQQKWVSDNFYSSTKCSFHQHPVTSSPICPNIKVWYSRVPKIIGNMKQVPYLESTNTTCQCQCTKHSCPGTSYSRRCSIQHWMIHKALPSRNWLTGQLLLVNDQRDAQIPFYVFIFIYNSLHVSSTSCSSSGEANCINTTFGNCHSVLVAMSCAGWE